jgi:hypothetical protein
MRLACIPVGKRTICCVFTRSRPANLPRNPKPSRFHLHSNCVLYLIKAPTIAQTLVATTTLYLKSDPAL